jgi:hypothetical protein
MESELRAANSAHPGLAVVLAIALIPFLFAISAVQITSPGTGQEIQAEAANILLEVDTLLSGVHTQWQEEARSSEEQALPMPALPIEVSVAREDVVNLPMEDLQALVIDRTGERVYEDGFDVLAEGSGGQASNLSSAGLVRTGMSLISEDMHRFFFVVAVISGLIVAGLVLLLLVSGKGLQSLFSIGVALLASALSLLLAALLVRFVLSRLSAGQDDMFVSSLFELGEDIMMIPIRNDLVFSLLGLALMATAMLVGRTQGGSRRSVSQHNY